ncbi:helix-turn-helix domain-containing protein [Pseudoxanthomonas sacheonensis]|uniref:Transcriptional regulator with XRE-family HTH domain n=1 Tax=Pseudoxanthomonas sacheonensis TaxID=443615 RepID=A0ABU1RVT1_9GAMM|nr:helix-turn-helix domain-containing protein [Pseudoxanthomonas sacheonensis]MDR6842882.1 transcriptional regulator with XRE-family HTH domain [Pseudoxanthomonas sacheonensis]
MSDERYEFSQRLAAAMRTLGYEPRPAVLFRLFNAKYRGRSVSFQTTSRWLNGRSMPEQDKLQVLADVFGVPPHVLRFGGAQKNKVAETQAVWPAGAGVRERHVIEAFLALPPKRRELVGELVKALSAG